MWVEQQENPHFDIELPNYIPEHRPRTMETPVDTGIIRTRVMRTNTISLTSLLGETM